MNRRAARRAGDRSSSRVAKRGSVVDQFSKQGRCCPRRFRSITALILQVLCDSKDGFLLIRREQFQGLQKR